MALIEEQIKYVFVKIKNGFLNFPLNRSCGCSLDLSYEGDSIEHSQHMIL